MSALKSKIETALDKGQGVFKLFPTWVPRSFCVPGKRIKLHPDDYYSFGAHRGGIDERWLASTTKASNGPETTPDEGLSYLFFEQQKILLKDAIDLLGKEILGEKMITKYKGWPMFSKFFDNQQALPFHIHHNDKFAANVGQLGKPEAYFFPSQLNNHGGDFPYTFFGLNPEVSRKNIEKCLLNWNKGDNNILNYSKAYKLELGTGWNVPAGILHAPGSLLTYEPQRASDVFGMYQNVASDKYIPKDLLVKDVPDDKKDNVEYLLDIIDWDLNLDLDFHEKAFMKPVPVDAKEAMQEQGYQENHIIYKAKEFSAKELTIFPGKSAIIKDTGAYGAIVIQGFGSFGCHTIESPSLIRFGEMTRDELFVTEPAARAGIKITNFSKTENLVMLKHFGPED